MWPEEGDLPLIRTLNAKRGAALGALPHSLQNAGAFLLLAGGEET